MSTYILLTPKNWHDELFEHLQATIKGDWIRITEKEQFTKEFLNAVEPDIIFIPHWSFIIPSEIYTHFNCILFHMTDLPYGRGGSPLQNLIIRGHKSTKISAIQVEKGIDTGGIYLKKELSLLGTGQEIFYRSVDVIYIMIKEIIENDLIAQPQVGEVVEFRRRKPEESNFKQIIDLEKAFDFIRMLDADGYPSAFIETEFFKFEFFNAELDNNQNSIIANVRIFKK
jgi:methionyl-tRNA formyltransferase